MSAQGSGHSALAAQRSAYAPPPSLYSPQCLTLLRSILLRDHVTVRFGEKASTVAVTPILRAAIIAAISAIESQSGGDVVAALQRQIAKSLGSAGDIHLSSPDAKRPEVFVPDSQRSEAKHPENPEAASAAASASSSPSSTAGSAAAAQFVCSTSTVPFATAAELRAHMKTPLHAFNLKRVRAGREPLDAATHAQYTSDADFRELMRLRDQARSATGELAPESADDGEAVDGEGHDDEDEGKKTGKAGRAVRFGGASADPRGGKDRKAGAEENDDEEEDAGDDEESDSDYRSKKRGGKKAAGKGGKGKAAPPLPAAKGNKGGAHSDDEGDDDGDEDDDPRARLGKGKAGKGKAGKAAGPAAAGKGKAATSGGKDRQRHGGKDDSVDEEESEDDSDLSDAGSGGKRRSGGGGGSSGGNTSDSSAWESARDDDVDGDVAGGMAQVRSAPSITIEVAALPALPAVAAASGDGATAVASPSAAASSSAAGAAAAGGKKAKKPAATAASVADAASAEARLAVSVTFWKNAVLPGPASMCGFSTGIVAAAPLTAGDVAAAALASVLAAPRLVRRTAIFLSMGESGPKRYRC